MREPDSEALARMFDQAGAELSYSLGEFLFEGHQRWAGDSERWEELPPARQRVYVAMAERLLPDDERPASLPAE